MTKFAKLALAIVAIIVVTVVGVTRDSATAQTTNAVINVGGGIDPTGADGLRIHVAPNLQFQVLYRGDYTMFQGDPIFAKLPPSKSLFNGVYLGVGDDLVGGDVWGPQGVGFAPTQAWRLDSMTAISGLGTAADPFTIDISVYWPPDGTGPYDPDTDYRLTLTVTYISPDAFFQQDYRVDIPPSNQHPVKLYHAIDTYLGGDDFGPAYVLNEVGATTTSVTVDPSLVGTVNDLPSGGQSFMAFVEIDDHEFDQWFSGFFADPALYGAGMEGGGDIINLYDFLDIDNGLGVQYNLGSDPGSVTVSNYLAYDLPAATELATPPPPCSGGLDVVFVVDNSGSVTAGEYQNFVTSIEGVASALHALNPAIRIAVTHYGGNSYFDAKFAIERDFDVATLALSPTKPIPQGGYDHLQRAFDALNVALDGGVSPQIGSAGQHPTLSPEPANPLHVVVFTDGLWRWADSSLADWNGSNPWAVYDRFKLERGGISLVLIDEESTLFVPPVPMLGEKAAVASIGGQWTAPVAVNPDDPYGAGLSPRKMWRLDTSTFDFSVVANDIALAVAEDCKIALSKTTNGFKNAPVTPGDTVVWSYEVTNTGSDPLTGIVVSDTEEGAVTCPSTSLQPGASMTCTLHGIAGSVAYRNAAVVSATSAGTTVTDSDTSQYHNVLTCFSLDNGVDSDQQGAEGPVLAFGDDAVTQLGGVYVGGNFDVIWEEPPVHPDLFPVGLTLWDGTDLGMRADSPPPLLTSSTKKTPALGLPPQLDDDLGVRAIASHNGKVYIGGTFTVADDGAPGDFLVAWDPVAATFSPGYVAGNAPAGPLYALQVHDDGTGQRLYAGGSEPWSALGANGGVIARLDDQSGLWEKVGSGLSGNMDGFGDETAVATALAEWNNMLVAVGNFAGPVQLGVPFTQIAPSRYVSAWNGTEWLPLGNNPTPANWGLPGAAMDKGLARDVVSHGNNLYVASISGVWRFDGGIWTRIPGVEAASAVEVFEGRLFVASDEDAPYLFELAGSAFVSVPFASITGTGSSVGVNALHASDGYLYIGGVFDSVGLLQTSNVARCASQVATGSNTDTGGSAGRSTVSTIVLAGLAATAVAGLGAAAIVVAKPTWLGPVVLGAAATTVGLGVGTVLYVADDSSRQAPEEARTSPSATDGTQVPIRLIDPGPELAESGINIAATTRISSPSSIPPPSTSTTSSTAPSTSTTTLIAPTSTSSPTPSTEADAEKSDPDIDTAREQPIALGSGCSPGTREGLPDGEWFGFATGLSISAVQFDLACIYGGEDATRLAEDLGRSTFEGELVTNQVAALREIQLASVDIPVERVDRADDGFASTEVPYVEWVGDFGAQAELCPGSECAVWIIVRDGVVTSVRAKLIAAQ